MEFPTLSINKSAIVLSFNCPARHGPNPSNLSTEFEPLRQGLQSDCELNQIDSEFQKLSTLAGLWAVVNVWPDYGPLLVTG